MASELALQLGALAANAGLDTKRSKGQPSLLYDSRTAADIGVEEVYDIATHGTPVHRYGSPLSGFQLLRIGSSAHAV
jgi:hypothetical protein